jgi:uncharacterized membrane protein (UPF0127 family)
MAFVTIKNITNGTIIKARNCDTFFLRLKGLMFEKFLGESDAILLVEGRDSRINAAIHMFFMNFDIAVVWLNQSKTVVDVQLAKKWHPVYVPKAPASWILEAHPSRLSDFHIGDRIMVHYD